MGLPKVPLPSVAAKLHRMRGVKVGKDVFIGDNVHVNLFAPPSGLVTIEDYASIGMRTMIFAHASSWSPFLSTVYPRKTATVTIGKGCWIAPCCIMPGVTIGGENRVVNLGL